MKDPGLDTGLDLTDESQGEDTIKTLLNYSYISYSLIQ